MPDPRRERILAAARATIGATGPEPWAREAGVKGASPSVSWCGLWVRAIWRRAGLVVPDWVTSEGNVHYLTRTTDPLPGDLVCWRGGKGHQSLFDRREGGRVWSVDANTEIRDADGTPVYGVVAERERPESEVYAYYSAPLESVAQQPADGPEPEPRIAARRGVDVSAHQAPGSVNWRLLRDLGYSFAYIRGVRMGRELDVHAVEHVARAREAGFAVGLYLFFSPTVSVERQMVLALDAHAACGLHPGDIAPALDIESHTGAPCSRDWVPAVLAILDALRAEYGAALRYHNVADWFAMGKPHGLECSPLWLADYTPPADLPCVCWQHKSGTIDGYGSQVLDQNAALGPLPTIGARSVPVIVEPSTLPEDIAIPWPRWDHAEHSRLRNLAVARNTEREPL